jgi:HlyD family secretion protein
MNPIKMRYIYISLLLLFSCSCKKSKDVTIPVRKDLTQAVYASGKLYPVNDYKVYSKLPGYIEKIHVHVGDTVKLGQPLMTIKSEISELNVNSAKNLLDMAQKNAGENSALITALKQDVAAARTKYELDSTNFSRFSNLYKDNATSKLQLDQAKAQYDISKETYLKAFNTLVNSRDKLRTELQNAQIQYDAQVSNKSEYTIVSVMNGKVYDIIPKEGELVNSQITLMEIGDGVKYEVELSVDETDVSFLQKGQDIRFTIDAYKQKVFSGKVLEAYPRINQSNKTSKVVASIILDNSITVYSGMSVEANIIIAEKKNTLVIPREFLVDGNKVKLNENDQLVMIQKGAEDLEFVEVLGGIDEKTEIKKP